MLDIKPVKEIHLNLKNQCDLCFHKEVCGFRETNSNLKEVVEESLKNITIDNKMFTIEINCNKYSVGNCGIITSPMLGDNITIKPLRGDQITYDPFNVKPYETYL